MNRTRDISRTGSSRREVLGSLGLAAAGAGLVPLGLAGSIPATAQGAGSAAATGAGVATKPFGQTGEKLPVIGLGTYLTFDLVPGADRAHLGEVVKRYYEGGARVVDTSPLYGTGEVTLGQFASALGVTDKLFICDKVWSTGDFLADDSHARRSLEQSQLRLWRDKIDLVQVHSLTNVDIMLPLLKAWQKEGRIRYTGITHHDPAYFDLLAGWIDKAKPDFVQVHYSIFNRKAEDRVLKAAAAAGTAVLVNMPLEKARLPKLVEGQPLPDFAKELGITAWSQYFLKWVVSHPAVTCALPATANPEHAGENIGALSGPLPDEAMRARMLKHMETVPGFADLDKMPWYPGKTYPGIIARARAAMKSRG